MSEPPPSVRVFTDRSSSRVVSIHVSGSPTDGYQVIKQVLYDDREVEWTWRLPPEASQALRAELADAVVDDTLQPAVEVSFEVVLTAAIERAAPEVKPFIWESMDK